MSKDPVCGMVVDESSPFRAERDGQAFYFCCEHCRQAFLASTRPAKTIPLTPAVPGAAWWWDAEAQPALASGDCCGRGDDPPRPGSAPRQPSAAAKDSCPMG